MVSFSSLSLLSLLLSFSLLFGVEFFSGFKAFFLFAL